MGQSHTHIAKEHIYRVPGWHCLTSSDVVPTGADFPVVLCVVGSSALICGGIF